jgi:hypothetical protein
MCLLAIWATATVVNDATVAGQAGPQAETLAFSQLDINMDGQTAPNSDWGSVDLNFLGASGILYFNLVVRSPSDNQDAWEIQNVPVLSREGAGVFQTISFNFDLGVPSGTDITALLYGYALTSNILTQSPAVLFTQSVQGAPYEIDSGFQHQRMRIAAAAPLVGGEIAAGETGASLDFPNQDCGKKECTPAAVSNSLLFLNDTSSLGIDPAELTIAKMKVATQWQPDGTDQNRWFKFKANYIAAKGFRITTKTINPTSPADVEAAVRDKCDVELVTNTHTAAVVGIAAQANGNYAIEVAHDTVQNKPGGTKVEGVEFNPKSTKVTGGAWLDNTKVKHFVAECAGRT